MADELSVKEQIKLATDGLSAKNKELLKELKEAQNSLKNFDGIDIEALKASNDEYVKLKRENEEKDGNYKKLYEDQTAQHQKELAKEREANKETSNLLTTERKRNSLTQALVEHHVDPILVDSAVTMFMDTVAVTDEGKTVVGDKPVSDFIKEWTAGDVGARFVTDANYGGGANPQGKGGDSSSRFYDPNSRDYSLTEQAKIANRDPSVHSALAKGAQVKK